jgi:hypothetical protein
MIGIAAMSWKSRMPKVAWPGPVLSMLRSVIVCIAIAVEESASARPPMSAACHGKAEDRRAPVRARPARGELQRPAAEDGSLHPGELARIELEADHEEHQHDPELREVLCRFDVRDEAKAPGSDDGARDEVAKHRAEAEASRDRHADHGSREEDEGFVHQASFGLAQSSMAARSCRPASRSTSAETWCEPRTAIGGSQFIPQ